MEEYAPVHVFNHLDITVIVHETLDVKKWV